MNQSILSTRSKKGKLVAVLIENALEKVETMDTSDEEAEIDAVMTELYDDLLTTSLHRYGTRSQVVKSKDWMSNVLPEYDDNRFKTMLRVTRLQFDIIIKEIEVHPIFHGKQSGLQFPVSAQLALTLYRLGASGEEASIRKIAARFGIGDGGTVEKITRRVFNAIAELESKYLNWPNSDERKDIIRKTFGELPNCIGYLDGTEIKLAEAPVNGHEDYFSRKQQYSIKIQAICDYKMKIIYLTVGYPGSVHDARIFKECILAQTPHLFLSANEWLAADSAYKLSSTIITPYRKNSREATARQRAQFNRYFSTYRVRIEHCFGILKERFSSLKELRMRLHTQENHRFICQWIHVCCILNNMILPHATDDEFVYDNTTDNQDIDEETDNAGVDQDDGHNQGEMRRQEIYNTCCRQSDA